MTVKVVTDSTSDIPLEVAQKLGITIVPNYVNFGNDTFCEGIDITPEEFYQKLTENPIHPTTSAAPPIDFLKFYIELSQKTDNIISIHPSSKLSAIYNNALLAKKMAGEKTNCKIAVINSSLVVMAMGLLVISAARLAKEGKNLEEILELIQ